MSFDPAYVGAHVLYTLPTGQERPAVVVAVATQVTHNQPNSVDLLVFLDGETDYAAVRKEFLQVEGYVAWAVAVKPAQQPTPGAWHWPRKLIEQ